jgi:hypothetical protein
MTLYVDEWCGWTLLELWHMDVARIISEQPNSGTALWVMGVGTSLVGTDEETGRS